MDEGEACTKDNYQNISVISTAVVTSMQTASSKAWHPQTGFSKNHFMNLDEFLTVMNRGVTTDHENPLSPGYSSTGKNGNYATSQHLTLPYTSFLDVGNNSETRDHNEKSYFQSQELSNHQSNYLTRETYTQLMSYKDLQKKHTFDNTKKFETNSTESISSNIQSSSTSDNKNFTEKQNLDKKTHINSDSEDSIDVENIDVDTDDSVTSEVYFPHQTSFLHSDGSFQSSVQSDIMNESSNAQNELKKKRGGGKLGRKRRRGYIYDPKPLIRKSKPTKVPPTVKNPEYWDKRQRNNEAAKRSRENRRLKELETIDKAKQLTSQNEELRRRIKELEEKNAYLEHLLEKTKNIGGKVN